MIFFHIGNILNAFTQLSINSVSRLCWYLCSEPTTDLSYSLGTFIAISFNDGCTFHFKEGGLCCRVSTCYTKIGLVFIFLVPFNWLYSGLPRFTISLPPYVRGNP